MGGGAFREERWVRSWSFSLVDFFEATDDKVARDGIGERDMTEGDLAEEGTDSGETINP